MENFEEAFKDFQDGDPRRMGAIIVLVYQPMLLRHARKFTVREDIAEEAVADAILIVLRNKSIFNSADHIRNYLFITVRNLCRSGNRPGQLIDPFPEDGEGMDGTEDFSELDEIEAAVLQELLIKKIYQTLRELPEHQREDFTAHVLDNKSYEEIAEARGTSADAVRKNVKRAAEAIRKQVKWP